MKERYINIEVIKSFKKYLEGEEKSPATIEKYVRDVNAFASYAGINKITKEIVIAYKQKLLETGYAKRSINSMLASLNSLFGFLGWTNLKVKALKLQQQTFCPEDKELKRADYERLCKTAKKKNNERLYLVLQTICSTGIRVGELVYITAEAVKCGRAEVSLKGKTRTVLMPENLRKKLTGYLERKGIKSGPVFLTRGGKTLSRTSIWREMKGLCEEAGVNPGKVYPHNLRHLFARIFYGIKKDIVKLADVLGHSSVNTTRIYIISTGNEHRQYLEHMRLVI